MRQAITLDLTTKPMSRALAARVGKDFHNLKLTLSQCTCFAHFPLDPMQAESCWMLLIRIDAATLELTAAHATHRFTINMDRSLVEGAGGDYEPEIGANRALQQNHDDILRSGESIGYNLLRVAVR